jgi:hypothetical protein
MHPPPKTTPRDELYPVLDYIRAHFYANDDARYQRDKTMLLYALTWPAAWLDKHALKTTPEHYRSILVAQLRQIRQHGDPGHYGRHFPGYLLKCLQQWLRHNHEQLYNQLKHASHTIDQIADDIEGMNEQNHTSVLAQAHELLRQNYRKKHTATTSPQMTLGL